MLDKNLIFQKMNDYKKILKPNFEADHFLIAVCYIQLNDYLSAINLFEKSCYAMLKPPKLWERTSQPNWLVDIGILSGRRDLFPKIEEELELYKKDARGNSLAALYAYSVMELLTSTEKGIYSAISKLKKKNKIKDYFAIGIILDAIIKHDETLLNAGLTDLLRAHEGMAKHGALRETSEGYICMQAMSLAYISKKRNLSVQIKNEYLPLEYVDFLTEMEK
jgi:hypothetical protein